MRFFINYFFYLYLFLRGFLSDKWKKGYFVINDDGLLQCYKDMDDSEPEGIIYCQKVAKYIAAGPFTRCIQKRPKIKDDDLLIAIPKNEDLKEKEILWINCESLTELK